MSAYDDSHRYWEEDASEAPVFVYLTKYGDAIEERIRRCSEEATALRCAGYWGAALIRSAAAIEITIIFFLARPLVEGAFLSDEWAALLSSKVLSGRTADDRDLLPAILRNWGIDVTKVLLADNSQMWEQITTRVWPSRNDYAHAGEIIGEADAVFGGRMS